MPALAISVFAKRSITSYISSSKYLNAQKKIKRLLAALIEQIECGRNSKMSRFLPPRLAPLLFTLSNFAEDRLCCSKKAPDLQFYIQSMRSASCTSFQNLNFYRSQFIKEPGERAIFGRGSAFEIFCEISGSLPKYEMR